MKFRLRRSIGITVATIGAVTLTSAQVNVSGSVADEAGEPLTGANVVVINTTTGDVTDIDGNFAIEVPSLPTRLVVSYVGFANDTIEVTNAIAPLRIVLGDGSVTMATVEITGRRISEKRQQSALTMETLDNIAIRETPAANFYDGLGALKDVDLTAASLGFKIINTRGFNSTNPVRSLQIIDGVDNQSPGLNFSLGNFLGASDLDVNAVNIIVGASSAFYGPNAFNGVIAMETKDPFLQQGLTATVKGGERALMEGGFRWAQAFDNRDGKAFVAYKLNAYGFRANDWEATNYDPVFETDSDRDNYGGYDAVNRYGDEASGVLNFSRSPQTPFLGQIHRDGYNEDDLVDYDSENLKLGGLVQFRLRPTEEIFSPELILASNYSTGTTIYQGDNRFSLRDIQFFQHRVELRQRDKFFLRAYLTHEDAGRSFDPYFTALRLRDSAGVNGDWGGLYRNYWTSVAEPQLRELGQPDRFLRDENGNLIFDPETGRALTKDAAVYGAELATFSAANRDLIAGLHAMARASANAGNARADVLPRFEPGTARFDSAFADITSRLTTDNGTRFFDRSALAHVHGEYQFSDLITAGATFTDLDVRVGSNYRAYLPNSAGTILADTNGVDIDTYEYGVYGGATLTLRERLNLSASVRLDKNKNFDYLLSPAASLVYNHTPTTTLRASFSSALRNPTLADQYLFYNVGPAILLGNLNGRDSLITVESLIDFLNSSDRDTLAYFDVAAIRPERVRTFEVGVRTTVFERLFLDATYYYSFYRDFIGFNFGVNVDAFNGTTGLPIGLQAYRIAANATERVTTQGFSIGGSYYFGRYYAATGNYSYNVLNTATDDPIIPAFNTPAHKYNLGVAARDLPLRGESSGAVGGFNVNYKWVQGFLFEGSPQFTGFIPSYGLLDAQVNVTVDKIDTTFKIGASNLLDNQVFQTYGGPVVGRLAYASALFNLRN